MNKSVKYKAILLFWIASLFLAMTSMGAGTATAQCADVPTCESLGFVKTETDCAGQDILKCPFDYNKVFCHKPEASSCTETCSGLDACPTNAVCSECDLTCTSGKKYSKTGCEANFCGTDCATQEACSATLNSCPTNTVCSSCSLTCGSGTKYAKTGCVSGWGGSDCMTYVCQLGSILYTDKSCSADYNSAKTAVGIVIDTGKRLAIALKETGKKPWGPSTYDYGINIPGLVDYETTPLTDFNGKANTNAIMFAQPTSQAAKYCDDIYITGFPKGQWYLPALGELRLIYANKTTFNTALAKVSGATRLGTDHYWSSSEASYIGAWYQIFDNGGMNNYGKSSIYCVRCMVHY